MATQEQLTGTSCAAACLMVAVHELGGGDWNGTPIPPHNFDMLESSIHDHTSNGTFDYSMPAHIGEAANLMGYRATVHMTGLVIPWIIQCMYPDAEQDCHTLGIPVQKMSLMPLLPGQRQLCAVEIGITGFLHLDFDAAHLDLYGPRRW